MEKNLKITPETHEKLTSVGKKGETYDRIIEKLVESYLKRDEDEVKEG